MRSRDPRQSVCPIRVFSIPGKGSKTQGIPQTCEGLEKAGVELVNLRDARVWRLGFEIIHLHFPVHYIAERSILYSLVRSVLSLAFYLLAKYVGRCVVVYEVHDAVPFRPRYGWLLWPLLAIIHGLVDGYMFLSDSSHQEFIRRFPRQRSKPWIRIDHGAFPVAVADVPTRRAYRAALLGVDEPRFLIGFLGEIKDYKGLETLPLVPRQLVDGTPVRLVIAGRVDPTYKKIADPILVRLGSSPIRIDRRLSDVELEEFIQAMDVVLLPYTRGWNSGMAMLVLGAQSRILATNRPLFLEFQKALGPPWIYTFDGDPDLSAATLAVALNSIQHDAVTADDQARLQKYLAERSFKQVGQALQGFYRRLLR